MPHINSQSYWENLFRITTKKEVKALPQVEAKKEASPFSNQQMELQKKLLRLPPSPFSNQQMELQKKLLQTSTRYTPVSQHATTRSPNPFIQPSNIDHQPIDKPKQKSKKKKFNFEEQEVKKKKITYLSTLTFFFVLGNDEKKSKFQINKTRYKS